METSRYEEVRAMLVNSLESFFSGAAASSIDCLWEKIEQKIDCYAKGELNHAEGAVAHLWKLSKTRGRSPPVLSDKVFHVRYLSSVLTVTNLEIHL
jgi:hypothetical protein